MAAISFGDSTHRSAVRAAVTAPRPAQSFQEALVHVVKAVSPSVVQIENSVGLGSGVVFDDNGNIVTNAHVVGTAKTFTVTTSNGKSYSAKLVGSFPPDDLAVVKVSAATLKPAVFADSSKLQVGDVALAIGNPLGLRSSVTEGIVSAIRGAVPEGNGNTLPSVVQTSAAINPGNSGGALVDLDGRVIGVPTLAATDPQLGGSAPGIGFAIPSNSVKKIADQLIANGRVVRSGRAYLGVRVATIVGGGVLVAAIVPGGPAAKAGIKAGDVVLAVNGQPTPTADVLVSVLANLHPGQKVPVKLLRHGKKLSVTVTLGELRG